MTVHLYVDGSLKARPASVEDAKDLAQVFFPAACAVVIMRSGRLQPHEQWIYDYALKDWVNRRTT